MHPNINADVINQALNFFGCIPGAAGQAANAISHHRKRMINGKDGVKHCLFELTLARNTAFLTLVLSVIGLWKITSQYPPKG